MIIVRNYSVPGPLSTSGVNGGEIEIAANPESGQIAAIRLHNPNIETARTEPENYWVLIALAKHALHLNGVTETDLAPIEIIPTGGSFTMVQIDKLHCVFRSDSDDKNKSLLDQIRDKNGAIHAINVLADYAIERYAEARTA